MKGKNSIIEKSAFLDMAQKNNLTPIEVVPDVKLSVQLTCNEEAFLKLAAAKSSEVFYFFEYPEDYEVLITGDTFDFANDRIQEMIEYYEKKSAVLRHYYSLCSNYRVSMFCC